jgi:hypothetical protein
MTKTKTIACSDIIYANRALDKYAFEGADRLTIRHARMVAVEAVERYRQERTLTGAAVLDIMRQHDRTMDGCTCGHESFYERDHRAHLAQMIADATA